MDCLAFNALGPGLVRGPGAAGDNDNTDALHLRDLGPLILVTIITVLIINIMVGDRPSIVHSLA